MAAFSTDTVIGVIGAGAMGAGIAQVAAAAGHQVLLFDTAETAIAAGIDRTAKGLDRQVTRNKMTLAARDALLERLVPCTAIEDLAPAGLVIEAIVEDLKVKRQVFRQLESICGPEVVFASNTSSISITAIAAALQNPGRLLGMHFFNPAPVMKLVEVVSGIETEKAIDEQVFDTARSWGKKVVHAVSTPGFIVNRVARPYYAEALRLLQEGATDEATIDALMREAGGFRMGPFELMDLIGNDVNFAVTCSVYDAYFQDPRFRPSLIQQELVNAGHLGRKTGRGYFRYGEGVQAPCPVTASAEQAPERLVVHGQLGPAQQLVSLASAPGIQVTEVDGDGVLEVDGVILALSDGRTATRRAADTGHPNTVLFDLSIDYARCKRIAIAAADQADHAALTRAAGLFQAIGFEVSVVEDVAGLVVMRSVCMLANEGADAVYNGVCDAAAVDHAMLFGVNYPRGPLAWADAIGVSRVVAFLDHLAAHYGEERYRVSPFLRRKQLAGQPLLGEQQ